MSTPTDSGRLPTLEALERELLARADERVTVRWPRTLAAVAVAALVVAVMSLTPFGRAVAERLGELIGIGDEPTRESITPVGEPAVVIGIGEVSGQRYEIVASTDPAFGRNSRRAECFSLDFPVARTVAAGCLTADLLQDVARRGVFAGAAVAGTGLPKNTILITGVTQLGAGSVVVESGSQTVTAAIGRLTPALAEQINSTARLSFFAAFVPRGSETDFDVRALAKNGEELGQARVRVEAVPPPEP